MAARNVHPSGLHARLSRRHRDQGQAAGAVLGVGLVGARQGEDDVRFHGEGDPQFLAGEHPGAVLLPGRGAQAQQVRADAGLAQAEGPDQPAVGERREKLARRSRIVRGQQAHGHPAEDEVDGETRQHPGDLLDHGHRVTDRAAAAAEFLRTSETEQPGGAERIPCGAVEGSSPVSFEGPLPRQVAREQLLHAGPELGALHRLTERSSRQHRPSLTSDVLVRHAIHSNGPEGQRWNSVAHPTYFPVDVRP